MRGLRLLLALLLHAASFAAEPPPPPQDFPLSAVEPGIFGYGLTAGPTGIERFAVEIVGRHDGFGLGFPLILVQTSGEIIERAGGVAAGMSGSPVYLPFEGGERLLGAIGYVFPDTLGGLALVTPIGAMRQVADPRRTSDAPAAAQPPLGWRPVATPLLVNGLGERPLNFLVAELAGDPKLQLQAQAGGGSGAVPPRPLVAGGAVGVAWVRGDVDIAAVGTVTEVDGDRVLAFGHRLLGIGAVDWPLVPAEVVAIVPHRSVPFKLANVGSVVIGRVTQDRAAAVAAVTGRAPNTLPVDLTIVTADASTTMRFDVVRDPALWPALVAAASYEGIERGRGHSGPGTATIEWTVALADHAPLGIREQVVAAGDVNLAAARLVALPLHWLARNPFQDPGIERLTLRVSVDETRRDSEVLKLIDDGAPAVAGEMVRLFVSMQPWRRAGVVVPVDVRWPEDLHGRIEVVARGASTPRAAGEEEPPDPDDAPLTFDELLVFLRERPAGGDLVIEARRPGEGWQRLARVPMQGFAHGRASANLVVAEPRSEGD
jgi:hypothetical protein